jgi:uncharacterized membrane protein
MKTKITKTILILLTLTGLGISIYLTNYKLKLNNPTTPNLMCAFEGCDIVQQSKYSEVFGIPMGVFGAIYYMGLLTLILLKKNKLIPLALFMGILFSSYLTYLEAFVINAYCGWCLTSFGIIVLATLVYFIDQRKKLPE